MADEIQPQASTQQAREAGMFAEPPQQRGFPTTALAIAAVALVILAGMIFMLGRRDGKSTNANEVQPPAAYASNLAVTDIKMSESTSLSGGKSTYIDGHIANHGPSTVTGITTQTLFVNDQAMPPQVMTQPLSLIRAREPYVDTEPVSAAPLAPRGEADFRLIFEGVNENWNGQQPEIRLIRIATK